MSMKCKIQINVDDRGWMWIDAEIKGQLTNGKYIVHSPEADNTFFCKPHEVYINLADMQTEIINRLLSFE